MALRRATTVHSTNAQDKYIWLKGARRLGIAQRRDDNAWLTGATNMYACLKGARRLCKSQALAMTGYGLETLNDGA